MNSNLGGLYALIGAIIASGLVNLQEDKMNFVVVCRGIGLPMPIPDGRKNTRAIVTNQRLGIIQLLILMLWILWDVLQSWYFKWGSCDAGIEEMSGIVYCEINDPSYFCRFFGLISGLLLGFSLIKRKNHKNKYMKKVLRIIFASLFAGLLVLLLFYDYGYYLQNHSGRFNANCTLNSYLNVCQAKCYCGIDLANGEHIDSKIFEDCRGYQICDPIFRDVNEWNKTIGCKEYYNLE